MDKQFIPREIQSFFLQLQFNIFFLSLTGNLISCGKLYFAVMTALYKLLQSFIF